tara:strand:+ start:646 stop:1257 length:612 start_codon:yes stop_codon:yes gene_type:complete
MTKEEWDILQNSKKKQYKYTPTGKDGQVEETEVSGEPEEPGDGVTDTDKQNWNKYLTWLGKKGMQGKAELDKGGLGTQLFAQYLKETPNSGLSTSIIPKIRNAYGQLRDEGIAAIKAGKSIFNTGEGKGVTGANATDDILTHYMSHIVANEKSADPNYVGQHLTQTFFPGGTMTKTDPSGKVIQTGSQINTSPSKFEKFKTSF